MTGLQDVATALVNIANNIGQLVQAWNASTGYFSSTVAEASAVSCTSGVPANVTSISLSAGDWEVYGQIQFLQSSANIITGIAAAVSTTSATFPTLANAPLGYTNMPTPSAGSTILRYSLPICPARFSLSSTTTVYFVGQATFASGTVTMYGVLAARRMR